ncbi:peptidylprolyl isomerase [Pengzhenrongella frigida]|uniref:Peptidylprolyl isomerase n=1 Tax=Pengzhenrongella frigida TaxID=1259133 RepID=A0A4Q5N3S4_9MICO|nr:peptidylprolyl isomerase [Cellulomonas sp. HLT2-17]RYV52850.1 peptidylprolyl isomerase [Cellulomonas sp. HLT2-17]
MSPNKRERENARRRYERYQQHVSSTRAQRRHRWTVAAAIVGVLVLVLGVSLAVNLTAADDVDDAAEPAAGTQTYTLPDPSAAQARTWTGTIATTAGDIGVELDGAAAPQAVASFVSLAAQGYFDGTTCHRLATGITVLQCGDPTATRTGDLSANGTGGPGYSFGPVENAPADDAYPAGTIAMARQGGNGSSMGSQFFLVYEDTTIPADEAGGYTVFGRMTSGLDVVTAVADAGVQGGAADGLPVTDVTIQGVETQ